MDHNKVIERIKAGSDDELALLYKKHRTEFLAWITRNFNCSLEDGKDIYQIVILTFYESIVSGKLSTLTSSIKTYLFAIGKNKMLEHKRLQGKLEKTLDSTSEEFLDIMAQDEEEENDDPSLGIIERSLEILGDPCKDLLESYYYNKLSIKQITDRLGYKNSDTSKNLKYKCLKRLKKIYEMQAKNSK